MMEYERALLMRVEKTTPPLFPYVWNAEASPLLRTLLSTFAETMMKRWIMSDRPANCVNMILVLINGIVRHETLRMEPGEILSS